MGKTGEQKTSRNRAGNKKIAASGETDARTDPASQGAINQGSGKGKSQDRVMGPNAGKAFAIIQEGIKTASQLFTAVDATAAAMFNDEIDARKANSFFGSQRLKLSTVQTVYRIRRGLTVDEDQPDAPLFEVRSTPHLEAK